MKPILKWVGGKAQLIEVIVENMPFKYNDYYEPFIGGGALFFYLHPKKAKVNDLNTELINVYKQIKKQPSKLIELLEKHNKLHCKDHFYEVRNLDRNKESYQKLTNVEVAARFIYLNHTCYNGLYRVNKKGEFNAPIGRYKSPKICNKELINEISHYFATNKIDFYNDDFEQFLKQTKSGDFVYLDPPYHPISETSSFTGYQQGGFGESEQIRLKKTCDALNDKNVMFMMSNSDAPFINELYKGYRIVKIEARRNINSIGKKRGKISEVLIMNYLGE